MIKCFTCKVEMEKGSSWQISTDNGSSWEYVCHNCLEPTATLKEKEIKEMKCERLEKELREFPELTYED